MQWPRKEGDRSNGATRVENFNLELTRLLGRNTYVAPNAHCEYIVANKQHQGGRYTVRDWH